MFGLVPSCDRRAALAVTKMPGNLASLCSNYAFHNGILAFSCNVCSVVPAGKTVLLILTCSRDTCAEHDLAVSWLLQNERASGESLLIP